jgi:hypothetical protein
MLFQVAAYGLHVGRLHEYLYTDMHTPLIWIVFAQRNDMFWNIYCLCTKE